MIHVGNCLDIMPRLEADRFDSIVTDPPYGLGFMGKGWDHSVPGREFWEAALRVAKPGAYLAAFGGTRTFHRSKPKARAGHRRTTTPRSSPPS